MRFLQKISWKEDDKMDRLIVELKYCGFNFAILLFGYLIFYRPASESRAKFRKEYGEKIKVSNFFDSNYLNMGKEHIMQYSIAILIFLIVIGIAVFIIIKGWQLYSPYLQIIISVSLIIISLYNMINAYIASIILGAAIVLLIIWACTND